MGPYTRLTAAFGAIALLLVGSTSAETTIDLFVAEPALGATPTIEASIITIIPSRSETQYYIACPLDFGGENDPPCDWIHGASVTINPSGMALRLVRESSHHSITDIDGGKTWDTAITVSATATCDIHGTTSASCTGDITSEATITTDSEASIIVQVTQNDSTISTRFSGTGAMGEHMVPITITGGLEHLETATTSSVDTSSSTGGVAARATGVGHGQAIVAGAVALAGGVALI